MTSISWHMAALCGATDPRLSDLAGRAVFAYHGDDPGHDWLHVERVTATAAALGRGVGADLSVLLPAAILHDVVNLRKDDPRRGEASALAAAAGSELLSRSEYDGSEIQRIGMVIREHSYTADIAPSTIESAVLQDADKLDALGAVGVLRASVCGARLGTRFYDAEDPFAAARSTDDRRYLLDHFEAKLLRLASRMHTVSARREADRRIAFLRDFLEALRSELAFGFAPGEPLARSPDASPRPEIHLKEAPVKDIVDFVKSSLTEAAKSGLTEAALTEQASLLVSEVSAEVASEAAAEAAMESAAEAATEVSAEAFGPSGMRFGFGR